MRLDVFVAENQKISRTKSSELIKKGHATVNGKTVTKPSFEVSESDTVICDDCEEYVSRGAKKLEYALESFGVDVGGLTAVDLGASTGGFCEVLLKHGAEHVYAVDVGHGQLHERIAKDIRVTSLEGVNARYITVSDFEKEIDIITADLSFISQTLVFEGVARVLKPNGIYIGLIKPQFEAGRSNIGKGGIVKDKRVHALVIKKVIDSANSHGLVCRFLAVSPILGGDGNREFLALYENEGKPGVLPTQNIIDSLAEQGEK